jgi:hypothetical protein
VVEDLMAEEEEEEEQEAFTTAEDFKVVDFQGEAFKASQGAILTLVTFSMSKVRSLVWFPKMLFLIPLSADKYHRSL